MLAVQADGLAPSVKTLQVTGATAGVGFQLGPGQLLRGRVTDEEGKPIADAFVETTRRGADKITWSGTTDADGRFAWASAPQEPLLYSVLAEGFNRAYAVQLQADSTDHEIKLTRSQPDKDTIQITGTVVDADSGTPLDGCKVMIGEQDPEWSYPFEFGTAGTAGKFNLTTPAKSSHPSYHIQIEKDGYLPAVSATLEKAAGSNTLEFKLRHGSGPAGVVLLPDGEPAAKATVLLCTPRAGVSIDGPAHVQSGINTTTYRAQTDEAGKFSLPVAVAPQGIVVVHDQGYAEIPLADLAAAGCVTLQPWGRVEGKLTLDSRPAANERVAIVKQVLRYTESGQRFNFVDLHLEATTDAAGVFSFDKVPPGQYRVFRMELQGRIMVSSHDTLADVTAGAVTEVALGGAGKSIAGKAILSGTASPIHWQSVSVQLRTKMTNPPGSLPKRADYPSVEEYAKAMDQFIALAAADRRFGAFCKSDGSFRLPDVPAGTYELVIKVRDSNLDSASPHDVGDAPVEIASLVREVTCSGHSWRPK